MTKIISAENIDFGKVEEFQPKTMSGKISNIGTERVTISGLVSDNPKFVPKITEKTMEPKFPASSNIYFLNAKKTIQAANGVISTVDLGFGKAGTTDADGKFTFKPGMLSLSLTGPIAGTKYKLEESFNVTWTSSNITLVNVILESESGGSKTYSDVDASLGTLAVSILASDGFKINETVYVYIENTHQSIDDSVQVQSIATLTINTPTLTAGTEGNVTGTSNGAEVDVYYRVSSPEGAWEVFEEGVAVSGGNWSATGTIADAGTYDFIAEDTTDRDGSAQVDDVIVEGDLDFLVISAGTNHSLGIWDGKVYAWGYNNRGQLGDGSTTQRNKPVAVAVDTSLAGKTVVSVSAGIEHSLALCDDGTVHAWGYNDQGQLGDGSTTQRKKPVAVAVDTSLAGKTVVGISAGNYFSLAVCDDGTVHAWGYNNNGQLGDGSTTQRYKPVAVAVDTSLAGKTVVMVSASGHLHSLALCDDGTVHAWGYNDQGQLGDGSKYKRYKPVAVAVDTSLAGKFVTYVSAGCKSSYCVSDDGTVHAWGANTGGQLGDGSTTQRSKPDAVNIDTSLAGKTVISLCGGKSTDGGYGDYGWCVAVCADGTVHAWGYNGSGQLGDGSTTQRNKPVAVAVDTSLAGKTATQVSSGRYFTLIKCNDGTAHAVGDNGYGQLGDNSTTQRTKAVLVDTSGI